MLALPGARAYFKELYLGVLHDQAWPRDFSYSETGAKMPMIDAYF